MLHFFMCYTLYKFRKESHILSNICYIVDYWYKF